MKPRAYITTVLHREAGKREIAYTEHSLFVDGKMVLKRRNTDGFKNSADFASWAKTIKSVKMLNVDKISMKHHAIKEISIKDLCVFEHKGVTVEEKWDLLKTYTYFDTNLPTAKSTHVRKRYVFGTTKAEVIAAINSRLKELNIKIYKK